MILLYFIFTESSFKNKLQEFTPKNGKPLPIYNTFKVSNDHPPQFRSKVWVDGFEYMTGSTHHTKKKADQAAAKLAYEYLSKYAAKELLLSNRNS